MILAFEPPDELVEFIFHAAEAGCHVVNARIERERRESGRAHVSRVTALHVMGPRRDARVTQARQIMAHLVRRHVWCDRRPGVSGQIRICILFGGGEPFPVEGRGMREAGTGEREDTRPNGRGVREDKPANAGANAGAKGANKRANAGAIALTTPMLAWLTNNCHSTFVRALCSPSDALLADVESAESRLGEIYPPGRIIAPATFRSRQRSWRDQ